VVWFSPHWSACLANRYCCSDSIYQSLPLHIRLNDQVIGTPLAEHESCCGFARIELNLLFQRLDIGYGLFAGSRAYTCVEAKGSCAAALCYRTVLLSEAIAAFSGAEMTATIETNFLGFAHGVVTTE
jgi:nicotinamidase-related amidase